MFNLLKRKNSSTKTAGLSISEHAISLAVLDNSNEKKPKLLHYRYAALESADQAVKVLSEMLASSHANDIPISVVLPFEYYNLFLADAPPVGESELSDAVRWSLREMIEYPMEEAIVEAFALPKPNRPGSKASAYAAVINYAQLAQIFGVLNSCKLQLERIEICETALSRLAQLNHKAEEPVVNICQSQERVFVEVAKDSTLYVTRNMLLEEEKTEEKQSDQNVGLLNFTLDSLEEVEEFNESTNALELELQLQRSLDYYESQYQQGAIKNLRFIRSLNGDPNLIKHLNTDGNITLVDLKDLIDGTDKISKKDDKTKKDAYQLQVIGAALKVA